MLIMHNIVSVGICVLTEVSTSLKWLSLQNYTFSCNNKNNSSCIYWGLYQTFAVCLQFHDALEEKVLSTSPFADKASWAQFQLLPTALGGSSRQAGGHIPFIVMSIIIFAFEKCFFPSHMKNDNPSLLA